MPSLRSIIPVLGLLNICLASPLQAQLIGGGYKVDGSGFVGGSAADGAVHGSIVQDDGTVVLAANIGNTAAYPNSYTNPGSAGMGPGTIYVYDAAGALQGSFAGHDASWNTMDVMVPSPIGGVGGSDHQLHISNVDQMTFFARFEPGTDVYTDGAWLLATDNEGGETVSDPVNIPVESTPWIFRDHYLGEAGDLLTFYDSAYGPRSTTHGGGTLEEASLEIEPDSGGAYVAIREDQLASGFKEVYTDNAASILTNEIGYAEAVYLAARVRLANADFTSSSIGTYTMMRLAGAAPSCSEDVYLWFDKDAGHVKASVGTTLNPAVRSGPLADGEYVFVVKYEVRAGAANPNTQSHLRFGINPQAESDLADLGAAGGFKPGFAGSAEVALVRLGAHALQWTSGHARSTFEAVCVAESLEDALAGVQPPAP